MTNHKDPLVDESWDVALEYVETEYNDDDYDY
jgi:hypothetical protein